MKTNLLTARCSIILIATLLALPLLSASPSQATAANVLLGQPILTNSGFSDFGAAGATPPIGMTDGNTGTGWFNFWPSNATVGYAVGANYGVDSLGVYSEGPGFGPGRNHPATVNLNFYSNNTFTTLVATRTVALANLNYDLVTFPAVLNAQYVQLTTPANSEYMTASDTTFGQINEFELYSFTPPPAPEPSSLLLLGLGTCLLSMKRRRSAQQATQQCA